MTWIFRCINREVNHQGAMETLISHLHVTGISRDFLFCFFWYHWGCVYPAYSPYYFVLSTTCQFVNSHSLPSRNSFSGAKHQCHKRLEKITQLIECIRSSLCGHCLLLKTITTTALAAAEIVIASPWTCTTLTSYFLKVTSRGARIMGYRETSVRPIHKATFSVNSYKYFFKFQRHAFILQKL